jgi:serine/threonine protein kinase
MEEYAMTVLCGKDTHKNIVSVLKFGQFSDSLIYFIDMELCDATLKDYISGRGEAQRYNWPDSVSYLWEVMGDIASGLEFIHSKGWVHRDLKPYHGIVRRL